MTTNNHLFNFSSVGNWQLLTESQRRAALDTAIRTLVSFGYVGDYHERLLKHCGLCLDSKTITPAGTAYYNSL